LPREYEIGKSTLLVKTSNLARTLKLEELAKALLQGSSKTPC
jgi:hypothetical protein